MNTSHLINDAIGDAKWYAGDHDAWKDCFDLETRRQLVEDDRIAWKYIVAILLVIVAGGLCLGTLGVLLSVFF